MTNSAASWEYGARSDLDATILRATYTSWGFSTMTPFYIRDSRIANSQAGRCPDWYRGPANSYGEGI